MSHPIELPSKLQSQINSIIDKQSQTTAGGGSSGNTSPSALLLRRHTNKWLQAAKSTPKKMIERSQSQVCHFYLLIHFNDDGVLLIPKQSLLID